MQFALIFIPFQHGRLHTDGLIRGWILSGFLSVLSLYGLEMEVGEKSKKTHESKEFWCNVMSIFRCFAADTQSHTPCRSLFVCLCFFHCPVFHCVSFQRLLCWLVGGRTVRTPLNRRRTSLQRAHLARLTVRCWRSFCVLFLQPFSLSLPCMCVWFYQDFFHTFAIQS